MISRTEKLVDYQPRFGDPGRRTVVVPRGGRYRVFDEDGSRWLVVRTWYGRVVHRVPVVALW